ncbi:MAG: restriction endonuclease subunit S [Acidobacteriota bacterium]
MELKPGYKQTEVGVIPIEWNAYYLQDVCKETITYGIVQCGPHIEGGVPYVRVSDMDKPRLDVDQMLRTSPAIAAQFSRSTVQGGDLIYALRGKLGEVRQVGGEVAGANLTQGTARLSPKEDVFSDYLQWAMRSSRVVRQAEVEAKGTTFREITLADLRRICIPVPPLLEQRAIAAALSDVDELLEGLTRLIAKKRGLEQAAMQQLLTGQTRLPGFHGKWQQKPLASLLTTAPKNGYSGRSAKDARGTPTLSLGATTPGRLTLSDETVKRLQETIDPRSELFLRPGDVLVQRSNTINLVGTTVFYDGPPGVYVYPDLMIRLRFREEATAHWFCRYANSAGGRQFFVSVAAGSSGSMPKISGERLRQMTLSLPPIAEQTGVASVLSDMDAELDALEARRDKTRALKQAMMQELLTGRTRLV